MRSLAAGIVVVIVMFVAPSASAASVDAGLDLVPARAVHDPWQISWVSAADANAPTPAWRFDVASTRVSSDAAQQPVRRPVAIESSDAKEAALWAAAAINV